VTFTVTVSAAIGTPDGNVVFLANSTPFSTNALVAGVASVNNANLPVGTNLIAVQYAAQGNYLSSTNILNQVVNAANVALTNVVLSITNNGDGTFTLNFQGTPSTFYYILTTTDITQPFSAWTPLMDSTNISGQDGSWSFVVSNAAPSYYRAVSTPSP
jgi:hypothetical protein